MVHIINERMILWAYCAGILGFFGSRGNSVKTDIRKNMIAAAVITPLKPKGRNGVQFAGST